MTKEPMDEGFRAIDWSDGIVVMLDQRRLPGEELYLELSTVPEVAEAIRSMAIRGAPAIGCAGAMGLALAARTNASKSPQEVRQAVTEASQILAATRPTAVNLAWALDRMTRALDGLPPEATGEEIAEALAATALDIRDEDARANRRLGHHGAELLPRKCTVLTHCNTGSLATGGYGTALGVIRAAAEQGKRVSVFADETRPFLQGARLTAWELSRAGIDVTVITDSSAGWLMQRKRIDVAIVGADRIARNGDVANKIGTYSVAALCQLHGVPFFVAAPTSTIDLDTPSGEEIPIERRSRGEVAAFAGTVVVPEAAAVRNDAFDVTPARMVSAIITEEGVARRPYDETLPPLVERGQSSRSNTARSE